MKEWENNRSVVVSGLYDMKAAIWPGKGFGIPCGSWMLSIKG